MNTGNISKKAKRLKRAVRTVRYISKNRTRIRTAASAILHAVKG
jgi:hypothetical protein